MASGDSSSKTRSRAKFTLADAVNVCVALGVLGMIANYSTDIVNADDGRQSILQQDLQEINRAVYLFRVSGGDLSEAQSPEEVIALMHSVKSDKLTQGVHEILSTVASNPVFQTPSEAERKAIRAFWDAERLRFEVSETGPRGVKAFSDGALDTFSPIEVGSPL